MRISGDQTDVANRVNSVSGASASKPVSQDSKNGSGGSETSAATAVFSSQAHDINRAKLAVANTPDVREDLVKSLKEKIDSGQYQVSSEQIAEMMLDRLASENAN
jgi:negative regulator of flagellin synthesis FlgM